MKLHDVTNCVFSREALFALKMRTPFVLSSTKLDEGGWYIGYGQQAFALPGMRITALQAEHVLRNDLMYCEQLIRELVQRKVTDAQYDALVSHCFVMSPRRFAEGYVCSAINDAATHTICSLFESDLPDARFPKALSAIAIKEQRVWFGS